MGRPQAPGHLEKHGLDFLHGIQLFDGRPIVTMAARFEGEERMLTIGTIEGRVLALVWTWRTGRRRFISLRRARHDEERTYYASLG